MVEDGMFTRLMEASKDKAPRITTESSLPARRQTPLPKDDSLPRSLEDLSQAGYNAHSYRFSASEIRWLRRFCLRASETMDRNVSHNTMVRLLFRLAEEEWNANPTANRVRKLLNELKD